MEIPPGKSKQTFIFQAVMAVAPAVCQNGGLREGTMANSHEFEAELIWEKGAEGERRGNHGVRFEGRPDLEVSAAPQYKGDPSCLNPEELLLASLMSCQMLTYLAMAQSGDVDVLAYEDQATATLSMADRRMRITQVTLRPRIRVGPDADKEKARKLVDRAHHGCFIANSVSCEVVIEPEVTVDT